MKKLMCLIAMLVTMLTSTAFAAESTGSVDWESGFIEGIGVGAPGKQAVNAGHAKALARRAAIVDAYRSLAEYANGVSVDSETTVSDMMLNNDVTKTKVSAIIRNARIVSEKYDNDGMYTVVMRVKLFGVKDSVASAVMPQNTSVEPIPTASPSYTNNPATRASGAYTGLVVDCRGMNLNPVMSPVIKNVSGQPIYGYKNLDSTFVVNNGMAGYSKDPSTYARAGSNPLIVKAVSLDNHNAYPVVSDEDSNKILVENSATNFLNRTAVVFIR